MLHTPMPYGNTTTLTTYLAQTGRTLTGNADHALQAGSDYINGAAYYDRYLSTPLTYDAAFPRVGYDPTPTRVEYAAYEAAYIWGLDNGGLSVTASNNGVVKREKVEGAVEVEYFENMKNDKGAVVGAMPYYSAIEDRLRPFLRRVGAYEGAMFVV